MAALLWGWRVVCGKADAAALGTGMGPYPRRGPGMGTGIGGTQKCLLTTGQVVMMWGSLDLATYFLGFWCPVLPRTQPGTSSLPGHASILVPRLFPCWTFQAPWGWDPATALGSVGCGEQAALSSEASAGVEPESHRATGF